MTGCNNHCHEHVARSDARSCSGIPPPAGLRQFAHPLVYTDSSHLVFAGGAPGSLASLKLTVGAVLGDPIDTSLVNMRPYGGVFVPDNSKFYTCDPLPEEWIHAMPDRRHKNKRRESITDTHRLSCEASSGPSADGRLSTYSPSPRAHTNTSSPTRRIAHRIASSPPTASTAFTASRRQLLVQVHTVYCVRARHPLVIEFVLFGRLHTLRPRQTYRIDPASVTTGATLTPSPPTHSSIAPQSLATRVVIFDSHEVVPVPVDLDESRLPTFLVFDIKEVTQPTDRDDTGNNKRPAFMSSESIARQLARGRWSATVNLGAIVNSTSGDATGTGAVEGTFDLTPVGENAPESTEEAPYMSLAIRWQ